MKKKSVLRKVLAVSLAAAMLAGTGFTAVGSYVGTSVSVSAAEIQVYGDFEYEVNDDNTVTITKYTGTGGDIVIPNTIDGNSVTSIGHHAFGNCTGLTSITIPNSVTYVGLHAFSRCTRLTSMSISDSVTRIELSAFSGCTNLTSINVGENNTVYSSDNGVLLNKDKSTVIRYPQGKQGTYVIPDSVTSIVNTAFEYCTGLTSITVGKNNTVYSSDNGVLFSKDKTTVILCPQGKQGTYLIPNGATSIGQGAFYGCTKLTSITIPDGVKRINNIAFYGCTNLTSIIIPHSVTNIVGAAFYGCENLTIYGINGSHAETYANNNNIPFVVVLMNTSTLSSNEITLGQTVTVNAKASEDNCTYAVLYKKKADTKWTVKQNYSTNDTIVVKPAKATDYDVCVKVKDSTGKIVKKFFEVKVNAKLKNTSTISATTIKKGDAVTLNGSATGGMGDYTYAVLYKKKAETKWTTRQGYKDNSEILVRPYTNTDYDICIKVKDNDGTIAKKYFTVTVTK